MLPWSLLTMPQVLYLPLLLLAAKMLSLLMVDYSFITSLSLLLLLLDLMQTYPKLQQAKRA
jgi:hypothetical protein